MTLTNFSILGLHGDMDIRIDITDNQLVIVAENGLGKTTIVNIIYYTLSRQWSKLSEYQFQRITFVLDEKEYSLERSELSESIKLRKLREGRVLRHQSTKLNQVSNYIMTGFDIRNLLNDPKALDSLSVRFQVPVSMLYDLCNELILTDSNAVLQNTNLDNISTKLNKELKGQILYLPTYRRIEKDLKNIFPDLETNLDALRNRRANYVGNEESNRYIELVEFGMEDVQMKLNQKLNSLYINFTGNLRQSLMGGYLKDILNKSYEQYNYKLINNISTEKLSEMLSRIDETLLQKKEKESLQSFVENYKSNSSKISNEDKIVAYFIQKLVDIYERQSIIEKDVLSFVDICNIYCQNKEFIYSREERKIKIFLKENQKEISLSKLSSGEKQIVSLFSHLYLSDYKNFFVIIDEPELSLSVVWQERLLPDILNAYNSGMIAVTHSPFIFSNSMEKYTKSFNEFVKIK